MKSRKPLKNNRGFSLLELIIVLVLMAIVLAIAAPLTTSWRSTAQYKTVSRDIITLLRNARAEAVSQNASETVTFDLTNQTYTGNSTIEVPATVIIEAKNTAAEAYKTTGSVSVTFTAKGSTNNTLFVQIKDDAGILRFTVSIQSRATGLAAID